MVVLRRLPRFPLRIPAPVAAIGVFDGVHRGHRAILRKAAALARKRRGTAMAVTFHPHPLSVLRPAAAPPLLMSLERRLDSIARCGIQFTLVVPFTRSFSRWSPERFTRGLLAGRLGVSDVVVGANFRFGRGRIGTVGTLQRLGRRHGFRVHAVAPVRSGKVRVSSGRLRDWIRLGKLDRARRGMGGPVTVVGRVVRGSGRGRELGFPTANLKVESGLLPLVGVYAVRARLDGRRLAGMANLGFRPTFKRRNMGKASPLLEVHLFGVRRPLYGRGVEVEFVRRLRGERRFSSPAALARQILLDARRARWYTLAKQRLRNHGVSYR